MAQPYICIQEKLFIQPLRHIYSLNGVHTRFFTLHLQSAHRNMLDFAAPTNFSPMKLRDRLEPQGYKQRLKETSWERKAETKQVERLSAVLAKKASSAKAKGLLERAA